MYVVIVDHGYEGYSVKECEELDQVLAQYESYGNMIFSMYKVESELTVEDLETLKNKREKQKQDAVAVAKAKLTPDECKLLGIA